jgi:putative heme-binding domain-containing protein
MPRVARWIVIIVGWLLVGRGDAALAAEPEPYDAPRALALVAEAQEQGHTERGAAVFASQKYACLSCHRIGEQGGAIGPDLTRVAAMLCPQEIAEALLWPKRRVKPEFVATSVATSQGDIHQGYVVSEDATNLVLRVATSGERLTIVKAEVEERQEIGTLMPEGLSAAMTAAERRDVLRFLLELGHDENSRAAHLLAETHAAGTFPYESAPLEPSQWRFSKQPVNRDRLYDFYAKEADYFREQKPAVAILPAYPGLDGGSYGHWGNQNEDTWRDDRWNATDLGSLLCGIVKAGDKIIERGVCVRLGDEGELAACFNPETLRFETAWNGGFVKFSPVRHGFVDGLLIDGARVVTPADRPSPAAKRYRGFYRHGRQVIFAYELDGRLYLDAPGVDDGRFVHTLAPADEHPLRGLTHGGPAQWPQAIETIATLGQGEPYAIDTITPPTKNPWNALMFFGGHDFLPDGTAMVCTMQGDVWHVSGLDAKLEHVRWKRFASGLHHPQGLVVVGGRVYVLGRNQITRLHDLNGDDEADFYECFSDAFVTSGAGHDFICGLERDAEGNFYTASGNEGLLQISPDGLSARVLATGFRNPDGLGLLPDGSITVPCSEGEWTATSMVCLIRPTARSTSATSAAMPHFGYRGPQAGRLPELPLVYLPRGLDNSAGGQTFIDSDRWGPVAGNLVHFSYGAGTYALVLRDEVDGQTQGAVVPMPGDFASGPHRGRFHPLDGQLYVTGMAGWGTYTHEDGAFERVRYTGGRVQLPVGFHAHENGVMLRFSQPLDTKIASEAANQFAQVWNYRYSGAYGSAEYAPSHPGLVGHDRLPITGSKIVGDGRSLFLEMPDLQPVNQLHLRLRVDAGKPCELFATVNALDKPFADFPDYQPVAKTVAAHPLLADMVTLSKPAPPNPWRDAIADAHPVMIEAGKNLTFATRTVAVPAGKPIKLTFTNPDVVPHNWVLLKPGSLLHVGEAVNRLVADPEAALRQYVPPSDDVVAYTDIVPPGEKFTIYFRAPETPGRYPFLCSFPGHWMVMNGQLIVE